MAKGGGHNKGQTMPYSSVRAFDGGKPMRQGHWGLGAARLAVRDSLVAANRRDLVLEAKVVDRASGETVWEPKKCAVCGSAWATETGPERGGEDFSRCAECEDVVVDGQAEPVVARRAFFSGKLFCLICPAPDGPPLEVTSEDLPEGGICAGCGTDVLIAPASSGFAEAVARRAVELPPVQGLTAAEPIERRIPLMPPEDDAGAILIGGACGMGKTSQRAIAELAERYAGPGAELRLVEPKPDTIESALMNLPAGSANGVNVAQALEPAVAIFTPRNALPDADPSALLAALDRRKLPRAVWADGTVAAVANGMLWRMQAEPHAATGEPCGVWSVMSPVGVRGHFVAERAARFIADRRVP